MTSMMLTFPLVCRMVFERVIQSKLRSTVIRATVNWLSDAIVSAPYALKGHTFPFGLLPLENQFHVPRFGCPASVCEYSSLLLVG